MPGESSSCGLIAWSGTRTAGLSAQQILSHIVKATNAVLTEQEEAALLEMLGLKPQDTAVDVDKLG